MKKYVLSFLMLFTMAFLSTNAFAQAGDEGFDLRIGLGADVAILKATLGINNFSFESDKPVNYAGLMGKLEFGYRWTYAGVYLQQDLGGVFYAEDEDETDTAAPHDGTGKFLGGTYIVGRGIYPIVDQFQIELGFGIGIMYSGGKEETPDLLFYDEDYKAAAAFAIKLSFAATYYITDKAGIALFLDYNYGTRKNKGGIGSLKAEMRFHIHNVVPGIQGVIRF